MPRPDIIVVVAGSVVITARPPPAAIRPAHVADILSAVASPLAGIADAWPIAEPTVSTAARASPPNFHIAIAALLFLRVATQAEVFHGADVASLKGAVSECLT